MIYVKTFVIIQQAAISRLEDMKLYEKFDTETIDACIQVIKKMPAVSKEYMDMTDLQRMTLVCRK